MDNVTHSLAGLLLAEGAIRLRSRVTRSEPSRQFRAVAAISSMIAANLPDADLLYSGLGGNRLRYMLHHRGHSHTVLIALAGAVLVCGVAIRIWRWREREGPTRADTRWLLGLLLVSTLSHLVLDWTNSYGVHPFWPVDNRWHYGDAVFIVEPWFWVLSVPTLIAASARSTPRVVLSLVMLSGLCPRLASRFRVAGRGSDSDGGRSGIRCGRIRTASWRACRCRDRWMDRCDARDGGGIGTSARDDAASGSRCGARCGGVGRRRVAHAGESRLRFGDLARAVGT
jgi:membrane-bound metal-dependent hydrolase YbcI (DUF457 family)